MHEGLVKLLNLTLPNFPCVSFEYSNLLVKLNEYFSELIKVENLQNTSFLSSLLKDSSIIDNNDENHIFSLENFLKLYDKTQLLDINCSNLSSKLNETQGTLKSAISLIESLYNRVLNLEKNSINVNIDSSDSFSTSNSSCTNNAKNFRLARLSFASVSSTKSQRSSACSFATELTSDWGDQEDDGINNLDEKESVETPISCSPESIFSIMKNDLKASSLSNIWNNSEPELTTNNFENNNRLGSTIIELHNYLNCPYLFAGNIPSNHEMAPIDIVFDEIIQCLEPQVQQIKYRNRIKDFMNTLVKKVIGVPLYETGFFGLKCFLPDDIIRLNIYLNKVNEPNWCTNVSEKLCRLTEGTNDDNIDSSEDVLDSDCEFDEGLVNVISNISLTSEKGEFKSLSTIDGINVELVANDRSDICFMAFLEEMDKLVGKNHLFKKSLIMIRGWWIYETPSYTGSSIKNYLTDEALCTLVCAIFNRYHHKIFFPIQAFSIFLAEYSSFDWGSYLVSLQGAIPFENFDNSTQSSNISTFELPPPSPHHLLNSEFIKRFRDAYFYNINTDEPSLNNCSNLGSTDSNDPVSLANNNNIDNLEFQSNSNSPEIIVELTYESIPYSWTTSTISPNGPMPTIVPHSNKLNQSPPIGTINSQSTKINSHVFQMRHLNIVHPFNPTINMINENMNSRRLSRLKRIFETGAKNFNAALKLSNNGSLSLQGAIKSCFQNIISRFGSGWRPDMRTNSFIVNSDFVEQTSVTIDYHKIDLEEIWDVIHYSNILLNGKITEIGFKLLFKEFLLERGALPVGEIGKMLQDLTGISTLSMTLKIKFGGLKKFLERFTDDFVIGVNHPFNPHVFLRETLTNEDMDIISKGEIPGNILMKIKRVILIL